MRKKPRIKLVQEGSFIAEVEVELIFTDEGWSPFLTLKDAQKLEYVREALRRKEIATAARQAYLFYNTL